MSDKIIQMAKEAGFEVMATSNIRGPVGWSGDCETFSHFRDLCLEEAARELDELGNALDRQKWPTPHQCADAIRNLKGMKP